MSDSNQNMHVSFDNSVVVPARFEKCEPLLFAGLREPMCTDAQQKIPALWQQFMPMAGKISHRADGNFYGVCVQTDNRVEDFYYMASCLVSDFSHLSEQLSMLIIPSQLYAVFLHDKHVSLIKNTISDIFDDWLPSADYKAVAQLSHSVHFFEKYTELFDVTTGIGGIEIWVPVTLK